MSTEPQRTYPSCGNEFSGAMEFCPVCMLHKALACGVESGESSAEDTVKPTISEQTSQRFEHYELVRGKDGKPVELGRGAMGVTYKALDVDLRCPVTLKVISERYLGEESARLRFLREARAAARLRHSNVASVLHLGRTGSSYFYAIREYFGEQLRSERAEAWKECNKRLYENYRTLAPQLPNSFREMEPLFSAVICGCNAGLFRDALHEVYIPRIQHGNAYFAANVLGLRGPLLAVLAHFFEQRRWGSTVEIGVEGQSLSVEDQLFILMQAALYLSVTRGHQAPEVCICYQRAERFCHSLNRPMLLYVALIGQWRYSLVTEKLTATMQIAKRVYSLAQEQNNPALLLKACMALAATLYYLGDFEASRQYAICGVQLWRSGGVQSQVEEVDPPVIGCLCHKALIEWHFGEIASCQATMAETISFAKELNDKPGLAVALNYAAFLGYCERDPGQVEHLASDLIELSTRYNFSHWLAMGTVFCGWARSAYGDTAEGISLIENGIEDLRADGSTLGVLSLITLKAEALHLANRISEALEVIKKAEALVERFEGRWWCAELHRLRGVFLTALGAAETQIEASFCAAISTARKQKSISLEKRAQATYAEYRRQKTSALGGRELRLPLW